MTNPEDNVLADIDALVDDSLAHGPQDDYSRPFLARIEGSKVNLESCDVCGGAWHGLPRVGGCPSMFASDSEIEDYRAGLAEAREPDDGKLLEQVQRATALRYESCPFHNPACDLQEATALEHRDCTPLARMLATMEEVCRNLMAILVPGYTESAQSFGEFLQEIMSDAEPLAITARLWQPGDENPSPPRGFEAPAMIEFDECRELHDTGCVVYHLRECSESACAPACPVLAATLTEGGVPFLVRWPLDV